MGRTSHRNPHGRWRARLVLAPLLAALAVGSSGCGGRTALPFTWPDDVRYAATADSLGLDGFLALPEARRRARAAEAAGWREQARVTRNLAAELRSLRTVVGLDPTDAAAWLLLAERLRWYGDYVQTEDALDGCRQALVRATARRHELAAGAAICEAWLRYDRGEWKRGLALTDSAAAHGADEDEVQLLRALHLAGAGRNRRAEDIAYRFADRDHRPHWIYGVSYWRRGGPMPAHGVFTGSAGAVSSSAADFVKGVMRPTTVRAAECYRDFGLVEELQRNWWLAVQQYEYAAEFVPGGDMGAMGRVDHRPLAEADGPDDAAMPVWLAFDRYYVTGSLSAYAALAYQRFETAADAATREFWGAAVVDAAGTLIRLDFTPEWARRARGLVLAQSPDNRARARADLQDVLRRLDNRRREDPLVLTTLARLYLQDERPAAARPLLERAVRLTPDSARAWSDLGLAHVRLGEEEPALAALQRAIDLDPDLAVAWYNRGLLRYHLRDLPGAVADLERAHELAPDDPEVTALLQQMRRLMERR